MGERVHFFLFAPTEVLQQFSVVGLYYRIQVRGLKRRETDF